jgi:hypothetical protein
LPGTRHKGTADPTGYGIIADVVRANFDLVMGSRAGAVEGTGLAASVISHVLVGRTRSWRHLKELCRYYRQQYPGFGEWRAVYEFFARKFSDEPEWNEYIAQLRPPAATGSNRE